MYRKNISLNIKEHSRIYSWTVVAFWLDQYGSMSILDLLKIKHQNKIKGKASWWGVITIQISPQADNGVYCSILNFIGLSL